MIIDGGGGPSGFIVLSHDDLVFDDETSRWVYAPNLQTAPFVDDNRISHVLQQNPDDKKVDRLVPVSHAGGSRNVNIAKTIRIEYLGGLKPTR